MKILLALAHSNRLPNTFMDTPNPHNPQIQRRSSKLWLFALACASGFLLLFSGAPLSCSSRERAPASPPSVFRSAPRMRGSRPYFAPGYVLADARTIGNMLRFLVEPDSAVHTNTTPITNSVVRG